MVKKNKPELIFVEWLDHTTIVHEGWLQLSQVDDLLSVTQVAQVGWVYRDTEDHIVIIPCITTDGSCMAPQLILKSDIIRTVHLENPLEELYDAVHREGTSD